MEELHRPTGLLLMLATPGWQSCVLVTPTLLVLDIHFSSIKFVQNQQWAADTAGAVS
jgi:hypothetical protein